jgi:colanic acid biosynthesis protein WcaH
MDVDDEFVPEELFGQCLDRLPQICVEPLLVHDGAVLLARRTNEPAAGEWFWPGGRLYKGERLAAAARRIAREEFGVEVALDERLGVAEHFWDRSSVAGADSRHTVNVVSRVRPVDEEFAVTLDDQHDDYRFVAKPDDDCHEYVREYFRRFDLPE